VRDSVAHATHASPRDIWIAFSKLRVKVHHLAGSLPDDNKAHDDRILGALIDQEFRLAQSIHESACVLCRLLDMPQKIGQPIHSHTGKASAST
jgi:hypothetical protein